MNFFFVSGLLIIWLRVALPEKLSQGGCSCAVFSVSGTDPLIEHPLPYEVTCNDEGAEKCSQLCVALAQAAKKKGPTLICAELNRHVENLKVAVFTKACDSESWKFTGLQGNEPICCHEGKAWNCETSAPYHNE